MNDFLFKKTFVAGQRRAGSTHTKKSIFFNWRFFPNTFIKIHVMVSRHCNFRGPEFRARFSSLRRRIVSLVPFFIFFLLGSVKVLNESHPPYPGLWRLINCHFHIGPADGDHAIGSHQS